MDTSSTEYGFVEEIKAPKLIAQKLPSGQEEEKKSYERPASGIPVYYAAIKLEKEIFVQHQSLLIASKLDKDIAAKQCRLAFYGQAISLCLETPTCILDQIKIVKEKTKMGRVDRVTDGRNIIIKDMFQKETTQELFMNKPVTVKVTIDKIGGLAGEQEVVGLPGVIIGTFGKSGKQKVQLKNEVTDTAVLEKLSHAEVELKIKVYSKELTKLRNKQ